MDDSNSRDDFTEREREGIPVSFPANYTADESNWI